MSAFLLWRPLAGRGRVSATPQLCKNLLRARLLHRTPGKPEADGDVEREKRKEASVPPRDPSFRQQNGHGDVFAALRRQKRSKRKSTKLDFVFNKSSENTMAAQSFDSGEGQSLEEDSDNDKIKTDPRAFQRCRPEYAATTLDLIQRRTFIRSEEAFQVLHQAEALEGSLAAADVVGFLRELGRLRHAWLLRDDPRFAALLRRSVEHLRQFSHPQLLQVLESFVWLRLSEAHSRVLGPFEQELIRRAREMSLQQLLLAADLWRCLRTPVPEFLHRVYDSVKLSLQIMGVAEIVQLLYILGEGRHCPEDLVAPVEQMLMYHLHELEPEEVGAVCLGLFKSKTSLSKSSVTHLVDKACSVVEGMSDFAMVNVFKLLRYSHLDHTEWLEAATREVPQRVRGMGVIGLMHVTLACSALHYRSDAILTAVAERLPSVAPQCRSKDSCKLLWSYGTLGVPQSQCPDLYSSLVANMRSRMAEFQRYPEHLLTGLLGLAFVGQFPEDLIAFALSPEFVRNALKNTRMRLNNDIFTLDETVGLELPDWKGPRLDVRVGEEAAELLWGTAQSDVCLKPEVLEAERVLRDLLGGRQFVCKRMILPHTRSIDLEVHLDSAGNPLPINTCLETAVIPEKSVSAGPSHGTLLGVRLTEDLLAQLITGTQKTTEGPSALPTLSPLTAPHSLEAEDGETTPATPEPRSASIPTPLVSDKTAVKLAVQVSNRNNHCYHSEQLLGLHALKRRQLRLAGYRVVELSHWEWFPLLRKRQYDKLAYLHCKIFSSVD
ncbi:hypothetical protein CRUP_035030 [Coryphaenoides rupestris]|nr:hypothetical protein CRUP_035030 [Coryphaenoides rupestris]